MTERTSRPMDGEADDMEEQPEHADVPENAAAGSEVKAQTADTPTLEQLKAEIARYRAEAEQHWQQFLRVAADLENYKKQAARARVDAVERARRAVLVAILAVVDNIERALEFGGEDAAAAIVAGIRMTHRHTLDLLAGMGVRPFEAVGRSFDAHYHEAVEVVPADAVHPAGAVVAEVQRGYLIGSEVLRPARVRVAQPPGATDDG